MTPQDPPPPPPSSGCRSRAPGSRSVPQADQDTLVPLPLLETVFLVCQRARGRSIYPLGV